MKPPEVELLLINPVFSDDFPTSQKPHCIPNTKVRKLIMLMEITCCFFCKNQIKKDNLEESRNFNAKTDAVSV